MKHLSELLERLKSAEKLYKEADSSLDSSPLQVIVARSELKAIRFEWLAACQQFVLDEVLNNEQV